MAIAKKIQPTKTIPKRETASPKIENPFLQEQRGTPNSAHKKEEGIGGNVKTHKTPKEPELGGIRPIPTQKYLDKLRNRSLKEQQLPKAPKKNGPTKA